MPLQRRRILEWGRTRARAARHVRGVWRGTRIEWRASGQVEATAFETLGPGPADLLIRSRLTGLSPGTERAQYSRLPNTHVSYPHVPGYSGVGIVVAAGRNARGFRPGDRVAGMLPHASLAVLPADRCLRVPDGVADHEAAFLTLGIIALQGARKAEIRWGDRVLVLGRGVLGRMIGRVAARAGACVTLCGRERTGADRGVGELLASGLKHPIVIEATGNPDAVGDATLLAAPGGRVVLVGSARGISPALPRPAFGQIPDLHGAHLMTLPVSEASPGRWTFLQEGELFLDWLAQGWKGIDETVDRWDPAEAWHLYRSLARHQAATGAAVFDWQKVPARRACRPATFAPPPALWRRELRPRRFAHRFSLRTPPASIGTARSKGAPGMPTTGRNLGIAMVGCGEIAVRNARAAAASGSSRILWAIDSNPMLAADLAARYSARHAPAITAALDDPMVDIVFVAVPHHLHAPLAMQAVAARKHVIVEKPAARTADEAAAMIAAAQAAGVRLATCYPMRFLPQVAAARRLIQDGALGRIYGARIVEHLYKEMSYWFGGATGRSRSSWRARRETSGGGVLITNLCHHLDALLHVTGRAARSVSCELGRFDAPGDVEDAVVMALRLDDGALVSVDASTCAPGGSDSMFTVWGADGQLALDPPPRVLTLRSHPAGRPGSWARLPVGGEHEARRDFVRAFVSMVQGQASENDDPAGLAVQKLIDAAYASAQRGTSVDLAVPGTAAVDVSPRR